MSQRLSYDQVKKLLAIHQKTLNALATGIAKAIINNGTAQTGINAATTQTEKETFTRWQDLILYELGHFKNLTESLRVKQTALQAEYNQLEVSIIENCRGLNATEAPFSGNWTSL